MENKVPYKVPSRVLFRRGFILESVRFLSVSLFAGLAWGACKKRENMESKEAATAGSTDPCNDLSGVSENDVASREKLGYVTKSPIEENQCSNCNLYLPPKQGDNCGGCMLFKGPVYASGYCTYWAPKL
jgi:hypothetical protein